jgi:hypothetical protein
MIEADIRRHVFAHAYADTIRVYPQVPEGGSDQSPISMGRSSTKPIFAGLDDFQKVLLRPRR